MISLRGIKNIFSIPELTKKIGVTLAIIVVYRIGGYIPVVGVNISRLAEYMDQATTASGILRYLDMFSGGNLTKATLFALGIQPYIVASIMTQMLSMTVPSLEQLAKEGEYGRKIINQYTRYLAVGLSVVYSLGYVTFLQSAGLVLSPGLGFKLLFVLSLTTGALFVMWLGEQISIAGIGNGSSMIIFASIASSFPTYVIKTAYAVSVGNLHLLLAILILLIFVALTACVVFLEKGSRKIPVQYSRRIIGQRVYGGQSTYIPMKLNPASIMPVILATSLLQLPMLLARFLSDRFEFFKFLASLLDFTSLSYNLLQFGLIVFFTFAYAALTFNPVELADQMKKNGGFVPGIRPGKKTAEFFDYVLNRIGLVGALYLGVLSVFPNVLNRFISMPFYFSGTQLLIVVGVALEFASQVESYLIEHRYEGFLTSGRLKQQ